MKLIPVVSGLVLLSAPALAQTSPRIDWNKPVIGVDAPTRVAAEEVTLPVQVLTIDHAKTEPSGDALATPLPPPCEPTPTANTPAAKPAGPGPCPTAR